MSGLGLWEALALGTGMNSRGVIVAMVGLRLGILGPETYTIIILVAIVTSLMAPPPILRAAMARVEENAETELGMGADKPRDLAPQPPATV
ncbi:hypothetical protein ACIGBH_14220 [Streptomyces sp. NPDC085929]|uniref:hypothetical protein n=1 Tax=Streptomyces sp. NPDC085929 TaxID=3365739 RepID=UPI0037D738A4